VAAQSLARTARLQWEKRQQVHTRFRIPGGRPSKTSPPQSADFQLQDLRRQHSEHDDSDRPVLHCEARRYGSSIRRRPWNYDCVAQVHRRMIEETDYRDGKPITVSKMTVSSLGKTMTIDIDDKLRETKATY